MPDIWSFAATPGYLKSGQLRELLERNPATWRRMLILSVHCPLFNALRAGAAPRMKFTCRQVAVGTDVCCFHITLLVVDAKDSDAVVIAVTVRFTRLIITLS